MATAAKHTAPSKKKTTKKKTGAKRKATAKKVTKKTSSVQRRLLGQAEIQPKAKSKTLPTVIVPKGEIADALSLFCDGDVAKNAINASFAESKSSVMTFALDQWTDNYVKSKSLPSSFYLQDEAGNKVTYSMTSAVTLDENKILALAGLGFDAREVEEDDDGKLKLKWIHVASISLDVPTIIENERANEALENLLDVLEEEFGEEQAKQIAEDEQKLNGAFFSRLMEVIESVDLGKKAKPADKIKAVIGALKPRQSPRSAKSVKSQEECIQVFAEEG